MKQTLGNMLVGVGIAVGILIAAPAIGFSGTFWVALLTANVLVGVGRLLADA